MIALRRRALSLLLAPIALTVYGCNSSSSPSSTPAAGGSRTAICSLLTRADLTPLLGSDPGPGTDNSDGTTDACVYTGAGAVSVVLDPAGGATRFRMDCPDPPGPNSQNVSGLADAACLDVVAGAVAVIYLRKGDAILSVNIQAGLDAKITPASLIAVGRVAAARL